MALATRCPSCTTVFRISTAQAAVKGGMVRCGICSNVFNSLDALVRVEELNVVEEVIIVPHDQARGLDAPGASPSPPPHDDAVTDADDELVFDPFAVTPTGGDRQEPAFLDDRAVVSEWWLPVDSDRSRDIAGPLSRTSVGVADEDWGPVARDSALKPEPSASEGTNPVFMRPMPELTRAPHGMRRTFGVLSLVATIVLLAQMAYLWRDELAVRWSPARPWLVAACGQIGCTVGYPAHAESVTIESASVQTTGATSDVYVLTALLRNRDTIDVRYPHLELVLTDLQDQPILRRDLAPEDYVGAARLPVTGFPAESELPIGMTFELNNLHFAGYRINQYYP